MVLIFQHRGTKRPKRKPVVFESYRNCQLAKSAEGRGGEGGLCGCELLCMGTVHSVYIALQKWDKIARPSLKMGKQYDM